MVVSYKLGLTYGEKLSDDLTLDLPTKLYDLMDQVDKYAWWKDDARLAKRQAVTSS